MPNGIHTVDLAHLPLIPTSTFGFNYQTYVIDKLFPLFSWQYTIARTYPLQDDSNGISLLPFVVKLKLLFQ